jgi:hypothetical protein
MLQNPTFERQEELLMLLADWSSGEWIAVIGALGAQLVTILGVVFAYLKSRENSAKIDTVSDNHAVLSNDVHKIEVATNSMKDALVKATAIASESKGRDEERERNERTKPNA